MQIISHLFIFCSRLYVTLRAGTKTTRNMLKKILFALILMLFTSACGNHEKMEFKEGLLCRCTVFPTGTLSETHQINVYEDGTICTYFGSRNEDFDSLARRGKVMEEQIFEKTETKKTGKLKTNDLERLKKYLSELKGKQCFHADAMNWKDSWCVLIETSSSIYLHKSFDDEELKCIYELIKTHSPLPVKIHGWS